MRNDDFATVLEREGMEGPPSTLERTPPGPVSADYEEIDTPEEDDAEIEADLGEFDPHLVELLGPADLDDEHEPEDGHEVDDPYEMALLQEMGIELDDHEPGTLPGSSEATMAGFELNEPDPHAEADEAAA